MDGNVLSLWLVTDDKDIAYPGTFTLNKLKFTITLGKGGVGGSLILISGCPLTVL